MTEGELPSKQKENIMTKPQTVPWDPVEHLETEEDMAIYLEAALEENDPALVAAALEDIACAKGMTQIAQRASGARASADHGLDLASLGAPAQGREGFHSSRWKDRLGLEWHNARTSPDR
jgi:probable addiction module antidote protein